jgi:hypothetical protein
MLLLLILLVLLFAVVPAWPYSRGWGYYPSGGLGLVALILLILVLAGRVYPHGHALTSVRAPSDVAVSYKRSCLL